MRLLDRVRSAPPVQRTQLIPEHQIFTQTYTANDAEPVLPVFASHAGAGYAECGVVFALVLARMMLFSEAEFKFRDLASGRLFGSPALAPLENPWPGGTTGEMLARIEQDVSLAGNAFLARTSSGLRRLRPDWVSIASEVTPDGHREVVGYVFRPGGRLDDAEQIDAADVAHFSPVPDPLADWRGMSWLTPVVREVNADLGMIAHKRAYFDNAATPNLIIRYPVKVKQENLERLAAQFHARHGGSDNAFRTLVLDEGADLTPVGNTLQQMDFANVQAGGENRIAAAAGVPGIVVGFKEGLQAATYSNYSQAMRRFADLTMRPLWRGVAASLAKLVEVPAGARLAYDTGGIAALREGDLDRAQTFKEKAITATELIRGGYDPATVAAAVDASDLTLLKHTGAIPTALYPGGKTGGAP